MSESAPNSLVICNLCLKVKVLDTLTVNAMDIMAIEPQLNSDMQVKRVILLLLVKHGKNYILVNFYKVKFCAVILHPYEGYLKWKNMHTSS